MAWPGDASDRTGTGLGCNQQTITRSARCHHMPVCQEKNRRNASRCSCHNGHASHAMKKPCIVTVAFSCPTTNTTGSSLFILYQGALSGTGVELPSLSLPMTADMSAEGQTTAPTPEG